MGGSLRFFIVVESLLFLLGIYQILSNPALLILLAIGVFNIYYVMHKRKRNSFNSFQLVLGAFLIFIGLLSSPAMWLVLIFAVLYIGLKGIEISGVDITKNAFWRKKQMVIVNTKAETHQIGRAHV